MAIPDRPFRRDLCESAKQGKLCCDDLCHTGGETLCGFDLLDYQDLLDEDEDEECTCDITGEDSCPAHYPIDDGSDDEEIASRGNYGSERGMSEDFIAVWERIRFEAGEPVSWERSMDKGKTWEPIHWPFGPLPFVLVNRDKDITEVVRVTREEA